MDLKRGICAFLSCCSVMQVLSSNVFAHKESKKKEDSSKKQVFSFKPAAFVAASGIVLCSATSGAAAYFITKEKNYKRDNLYWNIEDYRFVWTTAKEPEVVSDSYYKGKNCKDGKLYWNIVKDPRAVSNLYYRHGDLPWTPGGLQTIEWYLSHYGFDKSGYYMRGEDDKKYYINMDTKFAIELPGENRGKDGRRYLLASVKRLSSEIPCGGVVQSLRSLTYDSFDPKVKHTTNYSCGPSAVAYNWWDEDYVYVFTGGKDWENVSLGLEIKK